MKQTNRSHQESKRGWGAEDWKKEGEEISQRTCMHSLWTQTVVW